MTTNFDSRNWYENRFAALNVGDMDLSKLSDDNLETMVRELEIANDAGNLNLETLEGVDNLTWIVGKHERDIETICNVVSNFTATETEPENETSLYEWLEAGTFDASDTPESIAAEWDSLSE